MESYQDFFRGKRITVMGLGLLGRGVGDVRFLSEMGAQLTVTDKKTEDELSVSLKELVDLPNITYHLGGHDEQDFIDTDLVLQAPATPLNSPFIAAAKEAGVPVSMSTALALRFAHTQGVRTVGVTGTRGKSTVTAMIGHVLTQEAQRVHVGGNVRGVSTLALLPALCRGDVLVLELDSWQLQGCGYEKVSPHIAVFTSFSPDHSNYYPNEDAYFFDKSRIFAFQKSDDTLVAHASLAARISNFAPLANVVVPESLPDTWALRVPGAHNRENAALAFEALRTLGIETERAREGLESFGGVEGRLQYLGEKKGVRIYNDNNATTPTATIAALRSFGDARIVLVAGGADKNLPLDLLIAEMKHPRMRSVFLLSGSGTDKIFPHIPYVKMLDSFEMLVRDAYAEARSGDVLLLSPAFASFGHFKNEYERNDTFVRIVSSL